MILFDVHPMLHVMAHYHEDSFVDEPRKIISGIHGMIKNVVAAIDESGEREIVLCGDSKPVWRKEVFSPYKANRHKSTDAKKSKDLYSFYEVYPHLRNRHPLIRVHLCEADDIIGVLARTRSEAGLSTIIVSGDRDFVQLQRHENVTQYCRIAKKFIVPKTSPEIDLLEKILGGDAGDGVPNVRSKDDAFLDGGQRRMGKKRIDAIIENFMIMDETEKAGFVRNRRLIDLSFIPNTLVQKIHIAARAEGVNTTE